MALIPRPPQDVFESYGSGSHQLTQETNYIFKMQKIVLGGQEYAYFDWDSIKKWLDIPRFDGLQLFPIKTTDTVPPTGQWVYFTELLYPRKGFPFPEVLFAVNIVKRFTNSILQSVIYPWLGLSWLGFIILPWFIKKRIIFNLLWRYSELVNLVLKPYSLKESYRMGVAKELDNWVTSFIKNLGFESSLGFAFSMFIEYDSAYTLRFQDIMSEVNKENLLKNPSKELGRLIEIFAERESRSHLKKKLSTIVWGLRILFYIPRIRKAFIKATANIDFSKLSLSEADRYECLFYGNNNGEPQYLFMGRSYQDRQNELSKLHNGSIPVPIPVVGIRHP